MPAPFDSDFLGHVNNTACARWFEIARMPIFRDIMRKFPAGNAFIFIMAHTDYDYIAELNFREDVEVTTRVAKIGHKSVTLAHEAYQDGVLCIKGTATMVHFDFKTHTSSPIPDTVRAFLEENK
jgi:acyl-CoA thioester hydrolase